MRIIALAKDVAIAMDLGLSAVKQSTHLTSMIVRLPRLQSRTHLSSRKVTLHTASQGSARSRISLPVGRSQSLTLPSLPPVTINRSLNWMGLVQMSDAVC